MPIAVDAVGGPFACAAPSPPIHGAALGTVGIDPLAGLCAEAGGVSDGAGESLLSHGTALGADGAAGGAGAFGITEKGAGCEGA